MSEGLHTVHVRVNDSDTGKPVPVRLRLVGPEGEYHPPFGRLSDFATGRNQDAVVVCDFKRTILVMKRAGSDLEARANY